MSKNYKYYSLFSVFGQDWRQGKGNAKSRFVVSHYRIANWLRTCSKLTHLLGIPFLVYYKFFIEWIMAIEIPCSTMIGGGLVIHHGQGLVLNNQVVIGKNCTLLHNVTIGTRKVDDHESVPCLGDDVVIGAGSMVLGGINIGNRARVGAMSLVIKDVLDDEVVAGIPAVLLIRS